MIRWKERIAWRVIRWLRLDCGISPVEHDLVREQRDRLQGQVEHLRGAYDATFKALVHSRIDNAGLRARLQARELRIQKVEFQLLQKKQGRRGALPASKVPIT